jgi:hypothetical protein
MDEKYDNMVGNTKLTVKTFYIARTLMAPGYGTANFLDEEDDKD